MNAWTAYPSRADIQARQAAKASAPAPASVRCLPYTVDALGAVIFTESAAPEYWPGRAPIIGIAIAGIVDGRDYSAGAYVPILTGGREAARWALTDAIEVEHPSCICNDNTCNICAAADDGAALWSAHLLTGATETPLLDAVYSALERNGIAPSWEETQADADAFLEGQAGRHRECVACGAYVWNLPDAEDGSCDNCGANLPAREDGEDE